MSFTVFLGNLPTWVTADDIQSWLNAEALVADSIKVIRNPETQESKGFAFIEAPNGEEMQSIIRRFDRAPLEDKLLRANPAQPPKGKTGVPGARPEERRPFAGGDRPRQGGPFGARSADSRTAGDRGAGDRAAVSAGASASGATASGVTATGAAATGVVPTGERPPASNGAAGAASDRNRGAKRRGKPSGTSAFAEELAKAL